MEQQLAARLSEWEIAEFVENDEVEAGEVVGNASLASGAAFGLELIDEIDGGEEASARSRPDGSFVRSRWRATNDFTWGNSARALSATAAKRVSNSIALASIAFISATISAGASR